MRHSAVIVNCVLGSVVNIPALTFDKSMTSATGLIPWSLIVLLVVLPTSTSSVNGFDVEQEHHHHEKPNKFKEEDSVTRDPFSEELNAEEQRVMDETRAKAQQERLEKQEAERRRIEKELKFERDLKKMNKQQKKKAKRQKKIEGHINQRIIKATQQKRYYDVVGVRNWNLKIGPITLFCPTQQQIKKAYRIMAKRVHPDKNRDGRAEEAFRALEESAAILLDETLRKEYDTQVLSDKMFRQRERIQFLVDCWEISWKNISFLLQFLYTFIRPVSTPLLILGTLLI